MIRRNVVLLVLSAVALCSLALAAALAAEKSSPEASQAQLRELLKSYTEGVAEEAEWLVEKAGKAQKNSPDTAPAQVQKLLERVTQLEARVKALEQKQPYIVLPPNTGAPNGRQPHGSLPNGWLRQEINGMSYYIVPLEGNPK